MKFKLLLVLFTALFFVACVKKATPVEEPPAEQAAPEKVVDPPVAASEPEEDKAAYTVSREEGYTTVGVPFNGEIVDVRLPIIYFDYDKFEIKADMASKVEELSKVLQGEVLANRTIRLDGHSDEWGTDEYNVALAQNRAVSVKNALSGLGYDASSLNIISFGETKPACTESNYQCWKENRRSETTILP